MNTKTNFELKREIMLNTLNKYKDKNIKISQLAKISKLSTKQTTRIKLQYDEIGTIKLEHKSKYKQSKNKVKLLILTSLFQTGIRSSGLLSIKVNDIDGQWIIYTSIELKSYIDFYIKDRKFHTNEKIFNFDYRN